MFSSFLVEDESNLYEIEPEPAQRFPRMWIKEPKVRAHVETCRNCGGMGIDLESNAICFECSGEGKAEYYDRPNHRDIWK